LLRHENQDIRNRLSQNGHHFAGKRVELPGLSDYGPELGVNLNITEDVYKVAFDFAKRFDAFQDNPCDKLLIGWI
jgi:hypothetical protein